MAHYKALLPYLFFLCSPLTIAAETGNSNTDSGSIPYTDTYFAEDEIAVIDTIEEAETPTGLPLNFTGIYRHYVDARESRRALVEDGLDIGAELETLNYGIFSAELHQLSTNGERQRESSSQKIYLTHRDFALNDTFSSDTEIGHFRNVTPALISSSYRYYLPTTIVQGIQNATYSDNTTIGFTHGDIGNYEGTATTGFVRRRGDLTGLNLERDIGDELTLAAQWWRTGDAGINRQSHNVVALAAQYETNDRRQRHQLRSLSDTKGNDGVWYDGLSRADRWTHRYGAFHFEPELRWTDMPIQNDNQGFYWRSNFSSFRWKWTLNTEVLRTDVDDDPLIAGRVNTQSFINTNWLARRDFTLGGVVSLTTQHPEDGATVDDQYGYSAQLHATKRWPRLRSRLETRVNDQNVDLSGSREYQVRLDNDWFVAYVDRLSNEVDLRWDENGSNEYTFSVISSKTWTEQVSTSFQVQAVFGRTQLGIDSENYNVGFSVSWLPVRDLFFDLSATLNEIKTDNVGGGADTRRDGTVLLTMGYSTARGAAPQVVGFDSGSRGLGRIEGYVFLDANGNGVRELDEEAVSGITVYLDGRFTAITDAEGRYEFEPVPTGRHELRLAVWDAPLPWGLEDEKAIELTVPVRGRVEFDYGLINLNP